MLSRHRENSSGGEMNSIYTLPVHYNSLLYYNVFSWDPESRKGIVNENTALSRNLETHLVIYDHDLKLKYYKLVPLQIAVDVDYLKKK